MYREIEVENPDGTKSKHIILDRGNGEFTSFPADENNPNYQAYLDWLAQNK